MAARETFSVTDTCICMAASTALAKTHQHRFSKNPPRNRFNISNGRSIASYNVQGAAFNPIEMQLPSGMSEQEWMTVGSKLVTIFESASFWIGDWLVYGMEAYGKKVAYDLAEQATGKKRGTLL